MGDTEDLVCPGIVCLPEEVIASNTVNEFKSKLKHAWKHHRLNFDL